MTQPERLQRVFYILTGLFDWVGIRINTGKMVSMSCQPFHASGRMLMEAYERRSMGTGLTIQKKTAEKGTLPGLKS